MAGTPTPRYQKPSGCAGCSLETLGFGFSPPSGPIGALLTFIGEALGFEEAIAGEPFYGAAGGLLTRLCIRAGIARKDCRIANVVSCRPPQDFLVGAPWEEHAIVMCRQYLQPVLDAVPNNGVVVTLGATALGAVLNLRGVPGVAVKDFHGTVHRVDRPDGTGYWVVPTFHPSHLQRGAMSLLEIVTHDLRTANRIAHDGFTRSAVELVVDPPVDWFRAWCAAHLERVRADVDGTHLSLDSEFPEKAPGIDEGEVQEWNALSPMTRINGANGPTQGWTVPAIGDYLEIFRGFLGECSRLGAWAWFWNKYADLDHFQAAAIPIDGLITVDGMWAWHHIQTDVLRGLGFVAPMASDFGAWKHWGKDKAKEGPYAAADGVQNWRTCMWVMKGALDLGQWDVFMRDWHDRDTYCLRPAHVQGVPIDRDALEAFHQELQEKLASVLARMKQTAAQGVLKPKEGYKRKPKGAKCGACEGTGTCVGYAPSPETVCGACNGAGTVDPLPPASVIGKPTAFGGEAKLSYMQEGVQLVEREIEVEVRICQTCGVEDVGPKHRCPAPKVPKRPRRRRADGGAGGQHDAGAVVADRSDRSAGSDMAGDPVPAGQTDSPLAGQPAAPGSAAGGADPAAPARRTAVLTTAQRLRRRWFWQLPFNPDAPQQILAYLEAKGIDAPLDKKTQRKTTGKKAIDALRKQHEDDPFFQLQLDWRAVQKVDSTYVVGTFKLLDARDYVHPEYVPIPSTLRDSARHPNLTNVVADKSGVQGLAAGFRRCIVARDGLPPGLDPADYAAWEARWTPA